MADRTPLSTICPSCGYVIKSGLQACPNCGEIPGALPHDDALGTDSVSAAASPRAAHPSPVSTPKRKDARPTIPTTTSRFGAWPRSFWIILFVAIGGSFLAGYLIGVGTSPSTPAPPSTAAGQDQAGTPVVDMAHLNSLRQATEANPSDMPALLRYANALHDAKMFDAAIVAYNSYLEKMPDDPNARVDLGVIYFEMQQYDKARTLMMEAVQNHPDHQLGHYNLGIVSLNMGKTEDARMWFTKARDLNPSNEIGTQATAQLSSLK